MVKVEFVININGKELYLSEEEAQELYKFLKNYFNPVPSLTPEPRFTQYKAGDCAK